MTRLLSTWAPDQILRGLRKRIDSEVLGRVRAHLYPFGNLAKVTEWLPKIAKAREQLRGSTLALNGARC